MGAPNNKKEAKKSEMSETKMAKTSPARTHAQRDADTQTHTCAALRSFFFPLCRFAFPFCTALPSFRFGA